MAAVSITMGKFIAGIVIAILASSAISVGVSTMLITGPQGPEGPQDEQGETGPQGERGFGVPQQGNISVSFFCIRATKLLRQRLIQL